jgi:hypothetical protein
MKEKETKEDCAITTAPLPHVHSLGLLTSALKENLMDSVRSQRTLHLFPGKWGMLQLSAELDKSGGAELYSSGSELVRHKIRKTMVCVTRWCLLLNVPPAVLRIAPLNSRLIFISRGPDLCLC